jgi:hypothetical protein
MGVKLKYEDIKSIIDKEDKTTYNDVLDSTINLKI